jgi:fructose-bisphosphate aldolase / 6-deoxy-5-ketofructose 1-phosphate synthase
MKNINETLNIPADVPTQAREEYIHNFISITRNTGKLFLFACDQKIEHLNHDFYGSGIHPDAQNPHHLFTIAQNGTIGAMATHPGLIARYAHLYKGIKYIAKLNGISHLHTKENDPLSLMLWDIEQILTLKNDAHLDICGIGLTIYLGNQHEAIMLQQAAKAVALAHKHGLIAILWVYLRGKAIINDTDPALIAGAAGVATSLGADFVKIKTPHEDLTADTDLLRIAVAAAGNTGVICSGGTAVKPEQFLHTLYNQIHRDFCSGCATGRNIFQRSTSQAIAMCNAIGKIVFEKQTAEQAFAFYEENSQTFND